MVVCVVFVVQLFVFWLLVNIFFWFLNVFVIIGKVESFEVYRFQCYIIGQDYKVSLGDFFIVFLFDRLQKKVGFVQVSVVWLVVQWCEMLCICIGIIMFIGDLVGICIVLGYMNEERLVVALVGWLLVLRVCYQFMKIFFQGFVIQVFEFFCIIEIFIYWVR